ncbi:MAG TPA: hypothetical protein PK765_02615 [bacterium]|nr:hypothetical protein [bacterium]
MIFIQEAPKETAHIEIETAAEQTETIGEMTSTISSSPNETITPAASDHETDANAIILEAIVKMTALHDRKACSRDTIMAEVEDINSQIAALKDKAKERTSQAKDIAADMKKIEENIAVLQTQKSA